MLKGIALQPDWSQCLDVLITHGRRCALLRRPRNPDLQGGDRFSLIPRCSDLAVLATTDGRHNRRLVALSLASG